MRLSVIDIGTNTILLLIAEIDPAGGLKPLYHGHEIARLGMRVDERRLILPEALERAIPIITRFVALSRQHGVDRIVACGTSALRDAGNRSEILGRIKSATGIEVGVLSGEEEAELTYLGATGEFVKQGEDRKFAVLDIGGGSTEITAGTGTHIQSKASHDIGCVRLTERFLKVAPPPQLDIERALEWVRGHIADLDPLDPTTRLIGVAGTLTTLGAIDLNLPAYDPLRVSGHRLSRETVESISIQLKKRTIEQIREIPQILPGRADILLAGVLILLEVMKQLEIDEVTVSDRGLRYGIALKETIR
jgi:exopolyphosphatase/guanosine-5'-triphosphate,3'-diphosphate pyrophosphatase